MKSWIYLNMNPLQKHTGDCVVRAFAFFLGISWKDAFLELINYCIDNGIVSFNYLTTYGGYLKEKGYLRYKPKENMSVGEFCENVADDDYVYIIQVKRHLTIVSDRNIIDTWDCRDKDVQYYWKREKNRKNRF